MWNTIRNECVPWKSFHSPNFVQPVDPGITIRDYPDYEDTPESPESYQDCFKFYFYTQDDQLMTEQDCINEVKEKLFPTTKKTTTTTTTTKKPTTTRRATTSSTMKSSTTSTTSSTTTSQGLI